MRFLTITMLIVAGRLVTLAITKPIPNLKTGGMAIPLVKRSSSWYSKEGIDLEAISSHGISVREKIFNSLDNYEMNMGTIHPSAVKRSGSQSELGRRGTSVPLTTTRGDNWLCEISIGTPPKTFMVQIDTGAADMWVLQDGCIGISEDRDLWDPHLSDTSDYEGKSFRLAYGDGTVIQGDQYSDNVTFAGFTVDYQTFGSASSYTGVQNNGNSDGVLGLAFPSVSKLGADPLFESLLSQSGLINPTFSLKLSSSESEMYVGGANSMLYKGAIAYTPVINTGLWQVSVNDIRVNDDAILDNVPAILDSGATFIYGDWDRVSELYKRLGGTLREHGNFGYYSLPCDSFPTVSFTFGGTTFKIPTDYFKLAPMGQGSSDCFASIVADRSHNEYWVIGMPFLETVYTVFDYGTKKVGFAELT